MECFHCNGKMVKGNAPFSVNRRGYHIAWESIPHGYAHNAAKRFLKKMKSIIFKQLYNKLTMKQWHSYQKPHR